MNVISLKKQGSRSNSGLLRINRPKLKTVSERAKRRKK